MKFVGFPISTDIWVGIYNQCFYIFGHDFTLRKYLKTILIGYFLFVDFNPLYFLNEAFFDTLMNFLII